MATRSLVPSALPKPPRRRASLWPRVTVAIPCLNEEPFIENCLRSVQAQDYAASRLEILVADGGSTDATKSILARLTAEDPRIRIVDNPERIQAAGLNAILTEATGDVIVRMDVHCDYQADYVRRCVEILRSTGAANVGGAQRAQAKTFFQRAVCTALRSPLGVGGALYRSAEKEGFVDTVFLGAFPHRVFETVGLYDPRAVTNEDAELNQRLLAAGGKIYLSRDIVVRYYPRSSLPALARQYFRYGMGRARTLLKHGTLPSLRPVLPFLMVILGAVTLAVPALRPLAALLFALYALLAAAEALRVGRADSPATQAVVAILFPVLHLSHGVGFGFGLLRYALHPDWRPQQRLAALAGTPTRVTRVLRSVPRSGATGHKPQDPHPLQQQER